MRPVGPRAWASLMALPAGDHGAGEILMMHEARQDHRRDMHEHEPKGNVGDELMHPLHCLAGFLAEHSGERPDLLIAAIDHKSGHHRRRHEDQEEHYHGAAARAVAEITLPAKPDE